MLPSETDFENYDPEVMTMDDSELDDVPTYAELISLTKVCANEEEAKAWHQEMTDKYDGYDTSQYGDFYVYTYPNGRVEVNFDAERYEYEADATKH